MFTQNLRWSRSPYLSRLCNFILTIVASDLCTGCGSEPANPIASSSSANTETGSVAPVGTSASSPASGESSTTAEKLFSPGSRLQVSQSSGADGSSFQRGFFDTEFQISCGVATAADGSSRCLPLLTFYPFNSPVFLDSSCSIPLVNSCSPLSPNSMYQLYTTAPSSGACFENVVATTHSGIELVLLSTSLYTSDYIFSTNPNNYTATCSHLNPNSPSFLPDYKGQLFYSYSNSIVISPNRFVLFD